jgi:hypothetical protein
MKRKNKFLSTGGLNPLILILLTVFFFSCGRKNNNFLDFSKKEKKQKFNRLTLPAVQNITVKRENNIVTVQWKKIPNATYDIYRFIRTAFIPKNPLNKRPLTKTYYVDNSNPPVDTCYLVRPIFYINGKKIAGPSSKIICV